MGKPHDFATGTRFGAWSTIDEAPRRGYKNYQHWNCRCDCGTVRSVMVSSLIQGKSVGCGCTRVAERKWMRHGHSSRLAGPSRTLASWQGMKARCLNPASNKYHNYGGRGISVCSRWLSFDDFLADMGARPPGTTLDRIDNAGDYEPGNCRWATPEEQGNNRRNNRMVECFGEVKTLTEWTRDPRCRPMRHRTLSSRLRRGMDAVSAMTTPVNESLRREARRRTPRNPPPNCP